jgi:hypothetical protein
LDSLQRSPKQDRTLLELCLRLIRREASEPHDLAYALLGPTASSIEPDYATDLRSLLADLSQEHILSTANLLRLYFGKLESDIDDLPT